MTEFEDVRPLEGMDFPVKVRFDLRQMLARWLWRDRQDHQLLGTGEIVDELRILDLCKYYRLEYPGGVEDVAKIWNESEQRIADNGPTFDDLVRLRWISFDGGRWIMQSTPTGTSSHIIYPSPSTKGFLTELGKARLVAKTNTPSPDSKALAEKIFSEQWLDRQISTKDPYWLTARLWQYLCPRPQQCAENNDDDLQTERLGLNDESCPPGFIDADEKAIDGAFLEWSAWCHVLGNPSQWSIGWSPIEMRYCREAAGRVLERQSLWGSWNNDFELYVDVIEKTFLIASEQRRFVGIPRGPASQTLVARSDWLHVPEVEHLMMGRLGYNTVSFAFGLLCSELERTEIGPNIATAATTAISFAVDHPMALQQLLFRVDVLPALLVDMLIDPRSASLAAKLTTEWRPAADRHSHRLVRREVQTREFAVHDALSIIAHHLQRGSLDLKECAALITWCYADGAGSGRVTADSRRLIGKLLLRMVVNEKADIQSAILHHLVVQADYVNNVPRACFTGVLNALECLTSAADTEAFPVIPIYTRFARDLNLEWTDASSLSAELAALLVKTAFAQVESVRYALLIPFDSAKLLRETSNEDKLSLRSTIAKTLRVHVRMLARAVTGWPDDAIPLELSDALQTLISRGVIEHTEKGRVGALTDRYSQRHFFAREDGSPAQDLASAWRRLDSSHQEAMLQVLAQSDDPVLLAQLCQHLPAVAKHTIQGRLRHLKPAQASEFWTWPELQSRIDSLLAAGEFALAREHLDEVEVDVARAPAEYRLSLFGSELQLLLKEGNWAALDSTIVPATLNSSTTQQQAQDKLDFYRATSELLRTNGNLPSARAMLQRLSARPGAASAYKENVFAVALQQLLGTTLRQLTGSDKEIGERLLAEINAEIAVNEKQASSSLFANRALLLLALQKPVDALKTVAERRLAERGPNLELLAALAKSQLGLHDEAIAILDAAIIEFGEDKLLIAAKDELQAGEAAPNVASASVTVDPISSIRVALQQLSELQPSQIGELLGPPGLGLRGYLTRQVSRAATSLQHMAAILRDREDLKNEAKYEDDLNTAVREVLGASLAMTKWDVADQSLGGATANGNPGERDAVIRVAGHEVAIYEALVCTCVDRTYTKDHFHKLLSYGVCDIYFHVTYSYAKEIQPLLEYLRKMLEHEVPDGFKYKCSNVLGRPDYETSGYMATYSVGHIEVAVVFLIVDLKV